MNDLQPHRQVSGLAIASLTLSCLSIVIGPFGCIPGVICGHIARRECTQNWRVGGDGLALAGLIVGYVFTSLFGIFLLALLIATFGHKTSDLISPIAVELPGAQVDYDAPTYSGKSIETTASDDGRLDDFGGLIIDP